MANIIFPASAIRPNTLTGFQGSVPTEGLQGITNHAELLAYAALAFENANTGEVVAFGGVTGTVPQAQVFTTQTDKGQKLLEIRAFVYLKNDASMFPEGKKMHKQVFEHLPSAPASSSFNQ
jgi:hypothetical protein